MDLTHLEARLGRLDLRLDGGGDHLDDERIAELSAGAESTEAEAAHLAGCDDCVELLVALGEGLEALAVEEPALGALMAEAPRPPRRRGRGWTPLMIVALAGVAAAAGWMARKSPVEAPREVAPAERPVDPDEPGEALDEPLEVPILPAEQVIGTDRPTTAPESPTPEADAPTPAVEPPTPAAAIPPAAADPPPKPGRALPRPAAQPPTGLGTLERPAGPRPLEQRPVDGPPRGFGHLQLNTRPPARVFVDGKAHGWTPIIDLRLLEGPHDVRLVFDSPLAAEPEQRFRVLIEPDRTWRMTRDNIRRP